jgi:hypothetical protein
MSVEIGEHVKLQELGFRSYGLKEFFISLDSGGNGPVHI